MSERGDRTAGFEQDSRQDRESAPPWARGTSSGGGNGSGLDAGQPQHGGRPQPDEPDGGTPAGATEESEPAHAVDRETSDAPTGFMAAVPPPSGDPYNTSSRAAFEQPTVRTGKPVFEQQAAQHEWSSSPTRPPRVPRRASLQLKRLDPWSVLKLSLVLSVAGFLVWLVAVGVLYGVLDAMGVWGQINGTYTDLTAVNNPSGGPLISAGRVFGVATLIGAVNIVLLTALATVGSLIYNVASDLVGGAELTLSERD